MMLWCGDIERDRKVLHKGRVLCIYFLKSHVQKPEQPLYISTMTSNYCDTICFIICLFFLRKCFVKSRQLHSFSLYPFFFFQQPALFFFILFIMLTVHIIMLFILWEYLSFQTWQKIPIYLQYLWNYILFEIPYSKGKESAVIGLISILEMFYR